MPRPRIRTLTHQPRQPEPTNKLYQVRFNYSTVCCETLAFYVDGIIFRVFGIISSSVSRHYRPIENVLVG
jgi:hypothetical protein